MAELVPIPLPLLLTRAFLEYEREGKIFDLPKAKFFRGLPGLDTSVHSNGHRASTPLGPAAGPHGQLAQNIVLSWLGGSRIIELKTVQILDELKIPRPCIDIANVGYNVEWSQELKLEQSLREYVGAAMFLEILKASKLLGDGFPGQWGDTIFDMSVGYNLEGIRSLRVRSWIESMKNAGPIVDELRATLTGRWARYRDLPFPTRISDTVTLSTFHGCPAGEIEGIASFLLAEMDVHVCVKLNPTLLGMAEVEHLLHDVLGYREIALTQEAFDRDLHFDDALDLIPRLDRVARTYGKRLSVKFSNTLVVKNHRTFFADELMYMSGPPLHVLTMNLVRKFRERMGAAVPISFSAGLDAQNVSDAVAMNFVPVTTCTDLLRPGGYGRLIRYLERLGAKMKELGATRIPDFVVRYTGQATATVDRVLGTLPEPARELAAPLLQAWLSTPGTPLDSVPGLEQALVDAAGLLNTPPLVEQATANPRYRWERNRSAPRKIGSKLWLYDCINCDKCVPVCPNDANFVYETAPKARQFANYADLCNDCGNCDVFCPEDGGPYVEKPRFFGSLETYRKHAGRNGFFIDFAGGRKTLYATLAGQSHTLILDSAADRAWFDGVEIGLSSSEATGGALDMRAYLELKRLLESVSDPRHIHFANAAAFIEDES
jgi:putative selenate reductase